MHWQRMPRLKHVQPVTLNNQAYTSGDPSIDLQAFHTIYIFIYSKVIDMQITYFKAADVRLGFLVRHSGLIG